VLLFPVILNESTVYTTQKYSILRCLSRIRNEDTDLNFDRYMYVDDMDDFERSSGLFLTLWPQSYL